MAPGIKIVQEGKTGTVVLSGIEDHGRRKGRMEETYEEYEEKCRVIRRQNEELLKLFESDMASLSPKTIQKHLDNVDFYIKL